MPDLSQQYQLQPQGSTMFAEPARKKKKRRTPLSCVKCRERKIKCDRTRPICLRCTKSKLDCYYDIPDPNLVPKAGNSGATSMVFEITKSNSSDVANANKDNNISGNIINTNNNSNNYTIATSTSDNPEFQLGQSPSNATQQQQQQHQQHQQQQQQQKVIFPLHYQIGSSGSYPTFNAQYLQQPNPSPDFRGVNDSRYYQMSQNIPLKRSSFASVASRPSLGYLSLSDLPNVPSHQVTDPNSTSTPYLPPPSSTSLIQGQQMQVVQQPHQAYVAQHIPSHNSQISLNQQLNHRPSIFQQRPSLPHLYNSSNSAHSPQNENQNSSVMRRQAIGQLSTESIHYQISQLKNELEDLQSIVTKRSDVVSLSIDADTDIKNFDNNKQAFNGTFVRTTYWKRDVYMESIIKSLKDMRLSNNHVTNVDMKNLSISKQKVFNDLTEQVKAALRDRAKKPSPATENEEILKILPSKEIIYYHLERFFRLIYPFIPILDEKNFKTDITSIIDETSNFDDNIITFKLASLVIVLRLSYITLFLEENLSGNKKLDAFEVEVLSFKINLNIKFIQEVIYQADFIRNMDLPKLQFLFLYRFYQINAPEDGDGESGNTGVILNGLIVLTVKALGLNKKLDGLEEDRKYIQLFKKLWWSSGAFDADYSLNNGRKPLLDFQQNDTRNPLFDPFSSNLQNVELEKFSIDRINKFAFASRDFSLLMNALHKTSDLSSIDEIEHLLENFTTLTYDTFDCTKMVFRGKLYKYSSIENDIINQVDDFKVMIMFFSTSIVIQYYLLLHAEKTNNVFKYIVLFPKLLNKLFEHFHKLECIYQSLEGHLTSYRIILGHVLTESMYKLFNVIIPIIVRLDLLKYQIESYNKSEYIQHEIPKPQNYNSYIYPDPNPLNKDKLPVINELRFKIVRFMRDGLKYMKNFSIWIYKARRYYGQTKCIFELFERGELIDFEQITPGSKGWTNNLLMSVDVELLKDILMNTDWNLSPIEESDFQYEDDNEKFDASTLWNWGKISTGNDEFETL